MAKTRNAGPGSRKPARMPRSVPSFFRHFPQAQLPTALRCPHDIAIPVMPKPKGDIVNRPPSNPKDEARGVFTSSTALFANVLAVFVAFLGTGPIYGLTVGFIHDFATSQYGPALADLATLLWAVVVAIGVFALSRATIATAFTLGALALAARLF